MFPWMNYTIVADRVTNWVKYIPVAEPTAGCRSREIKTGLKIDPVPIPTVAPIMAPKNPIISNFFTSRVAHVKSPFTD